MADPIPAASGYRRIAAEEAFMTPAIEKAYLDLLDEGGSGDPGFESAMGYFLRSPSERATKVRQRLLDLDQGRIGDMDAAGIDMQLVGITSPGVQVFRADLATGLAREANDILAEAVARNPDRLSGMVAIAPQDPVSAAREIERGTGELGLRGVIVNSHTLGEYLDQPKFAGILEACEACDTPLYIHPNTPSPQMIKPFTDAGLEGALYGFGVETGMHVLRLITSGALDRFPGLRLVAGHLGEALPFWLYRLDFIHRATVNSNRYEFMKPLAKPISAYLRENIYVTTSGMPWEPAISFCRQVLGSDRVLYAMDYPYQYEPDEVAMQEAMPLSDQERRDFFQCNAERAFRL